MELVAENGCIISIPRGCKKELGRGSELAIHDKTVSRRQILLDLQEQSEEDSSVDPDNSFRLSIEVLGANPVCIVHVGRSTGRRSKVQEMILLRKGETDTLFSGDKISLSISLPVFLTVREGEGRKNIAGFRTRERAGSSAVVMEEEMPMNAECSKLLAEDDLLGKWKNRKKGQKSGLRVTQDIERVEALGKRQILANEDAAANEEEAGIAQAVARRQKRAFERRQQQEQNLCDKGTGVVKVLEVVSNIESEASKLEDITVNTENIDPVKEFGFLVEGSEFEQYKKQQKADRGRWVWFPAAKSPAESGSDEDDEEQQEKHARSKKGKKKTDEEDEEWRGDDQEEKVVIASAKKLKADPKINLRSHEPGSSKKRDTAMKNAASGSMFKNRREEIEDEDEDEDEADETLGGFIVNDNEEDDPLDDNTDDEEDEASEDEDIDEEMDEAEEQDEEDAQPNKSKNKREEKPLCKYGKKCYRKNPDHLAQYRH